MGQPHDGPQGGRLSRTVAAQEAHNLAFVHLKRNVEENMARAVVRVDVLKFQTAHM